jgi:hypothetical protein
MVAPGVPVVAEALGFLVAGAKVDGQDRLVTSYGNRLGDLAAAFPDLPWDASRWGTAYPDMPWEPKQSFRSVADFYARQARPA